MLKVVLIEIGGTVLVRFFWPLRHILWALLCGALWLAAGTKLVDLGLFYRYIETVTTFSGWLARFLAIAVVAIEVAIPIVSLHPRLFSLATLGSVAVFAVFLVFHLTKLWTGDPSPCSCFGEALHFTPGQFALIDSGLLIAGLSAWRLGGDQSVFSLKYVLNSSLPWIPAIVLMLLLEVKTVASAGSPPLSSEVRRISIEVNVLEQLYVSSPSSAESKDLVVIFGDYECPYTQKLVASQIYRNLLESKKVRVLWREFPLTRLHPRAMDVALLSKKAYNRGELKQSQHNLVNLAKSQQDLEVNLSAAEVAALELQVREDIAVARKLRLGRTPTIIVVMGKDVYEVVQLHSAVDLLGLTEQIP